MRRGLALAALSVGVISSIATSKIDPNEWSLDGSLTGQEIVFAEEIEETGFHVETSGDLDPEATVGFLTVAVSIESASLVQVDPELDSNPLDVIVTLSRDDFSQENVVQIHPTLAADDTGLDTGGLGDTGLEAAPGDTILFDIPTLDAAECGDITACALDYQLTLDLDRPLAEGETVTLSWGASAEVHGSGSVPIEDPGLVIEVTAPEEE